VTRSTGRTRLTQRPLRSRLRAQQSASVRHRAPVNLLINPARRRDNDAASQLLPGVHSIRKTERLFALGNACSWESQGHVFHALGFNETNIPLLEHGLLTLALSAPVQDVVPSPHGVKYIIEGVLEAPSGASPRIRTVWILETGETNPRFVTAYPA
jgi:hypothetical protein